MLTFDCISVQLSMAACRFLAQLQELTISKESSTSIFRDVHKIQGNMLICQKFTNRFSCEVK